MKCLKLLVLVGFVIFLSSCNGNNFTVPQRNNATLPLTGTRPTFYVLCNNTDVRCTDFTYLTNYFESIFGEDTITFVYFYVDSEYNRDIVNSLEITSLPTYMIFDTQKQEVFRASGTVELDVLESELRTLLQEE